jgi:chorismate dehydratase
MGVKLDRKIKLGCVNFLNACPLIYPLKSGLLPHPFEIHMDVPSALVAGLRNGALDVALASTGALLRLGDDFSYIPGIGICSDGSVQSVVICHAGDIENLAHLYLDPASVTGNILAKIILDKKYNIRPQFLPVDKGPVNIASLKTGEGCVLIGDNALEAGAEEHGCIDMGEAWRELTGLPFIYALWTGRREFITDEVRVPLYNSYLMGVSMIPRIISSYTRLPLEPGDAVKYLEENLIYEVTDEAEAGLELFLKFAEEYI